MKKIKVTEPVKKKGLFGTKTVMRTKNIKVDNKTYKAMKKAKEKEELDNFEEFALICETLFDD